MIWILQFISPTTWILIISLCLLVEYYLNRKWNVLKDLNVPHIPPSVRNWGHAKIIWSEKVFTFDLECKENFGLIWGYYAMTKPRIVIHDLDMLQQIFVKDFPTFTNRVKNLHPVGEELANGLLFIGDEQWKRVRTTMTPAFSTMKLKLMMGIVDRCVDNTVDVFVKKCSNGKTIFDAKDVFSRLSMDVICASAFSTDVNSQDTTKKEPKISIYAKKFFDVGFFNIYFMIGILFPFFKPYVGEMLKKRSYMVYLRQVCDKIISQKTEDQDNEKKRIDLMQLMLDCKISDSTLKEGARRGMSKVEIIGNSMTMLLAGYDTTSITMTNLVYNLAQYQDIQKKLQSEIDGMFVEKGDKLDYDSINELPFLDMCINETLRLYPPIARTTRVAKKEVNINGLTIPCGFLVVMPIHALCHDPEYWEDPMEFEPERMKNIKEMNQMVYQPFGSGPRNCIGKRFALMEIKIAMCKLLHKYTFLTTENTPKPPLRLKFDITVHPKEDFDLVAIPRVE